VLDVPVAEIVLQGTGIVPVVGKLIAARMPQHVRMQWERHLAALPSLWMRWWKPIVLMDPPRSVRKT
jgi:hypothetical protein